MTTPQPNIGDWYRSGEELFEVVAFDEDDGTVEIQFYDGTIEEMDIEDWQTQWEEGLLEIAEPPDDWSGPVDVEPDESSGAAYPYDDDRNLRARPLDGLDLFD